MSHVFISYKAEDRPRVQRLVEALTAEGLSVWWDVHIEGGADWRQTIQERLEAAACVIVVWSARSTGRDGRFVQDEASRAARRGVLLPVMIDRAEPPLGFGQHQTLPLLDWRGDRKDPQFQNVLSAVKAVLAGEPEPEPKTFAPPQRPRASRRGVLIGAGVAAAAAGAVVFRKPIGGLLGSTRAAPPRSLAVLPFANLSADPAQTYFSDGLSEELLDRLSRIGALQVTGRTSSFKFRGGRDDAGAIAAKLGVAYILDGSVRRAGDKVRVSAQLVEGKSGFERWADTYDREVKDVLAVQSDIAGAVAGALEIKLLGGASARATDPAALDAYLRGKRLFNEGGDEASLRDALSDFETAIAGDPGFASAWSSKARLLLALSNQYTPAAAVPAQQAEALAAARRAVALDPRDPVAQIAVGEIILDSQLNFAAAKPYFDQAQARSGSADVLGLTGQFDCHRGDFERGLSALRRCAELDQLNPRAFKGLGAGLLAARRYAEAIAAYEKALALNPKAATDHAGIGTARYLLGDLGGARQAFQAEPDGYQRDTGLAIVAHAAGAPAEAKAAFQSLSSKDAVDYQTAQVLAQWGDLPGALSALDRAWKTRDGGLLLMTTDPLLDPIRTNPGFPALLRRLSV